MIHQDHECPLQETSVWIGIPYAHLACVQVEADVPKYGVSVFILRHSVVQDVRMSVVASLSETSYVHNRADGGAQEEPGGGAHRVLCQRGGVEPRPSGGAVHKDHGNEAPEPTAVHIVQPVSVGCHLHSVSSLLMLVQLFGKSKVGTLNGSLICS